jgi:hypothetical protein
VTLPDPARAARLTAIAERLFPIQDIDAGIPWSEAEKAYEAYAKFFGRDQSLERISERGGFGLEEFACLRAGRNPSRFNHATDYRLVYAAVKVILLAHVETLTQQVAELQQARTDDSLSPNSSASQGRSDESVFHRVVPSGRDSGHLKQAEQQRDAAHTALKALADRHAWTPGMGRCICEPHIKADELLHAALAASAPQKEEPR